MIGKITIAGVSIGNILDIPLRTMIALRDADIIVTESILVTKELIEILGIESSADFIEYLPHFEKPGINNSQHIVEEVIDKIKLGNNVVLVSTEGMPLIHDPGYEIVLAVRKERLPITVIPGPSAPIAALNVAGIDSWKFVFESYMPTNNVDKNLALLKVKGIDMASIFFEHMDNIEDTLSLAIKIIDKNRPASLCIDLTTPKEQIINGTLFEILKWYLQNKENYYDNKEARVTLIICGRNYDGVQNENLY